MIRFECDQCDLVATIVETRPGIEAWHDHMSRHDDPSGFHSWVWRVYELPFSE